MNQIVRGAARRVLAIGTPDADGASTIEESLAPDGTVIIMEKDPARAYEARQRFLAAGFGTRATVIAGDPRRMLYKLAGPFDVIFCTACDAATLDKARGLLARTGVLIIEKSDGG